MEQEQGNGVNWEADEKQRLRSALVSVLLPCCGQLEYTKLCVPSLLRQSREPFELIFIDVGSLDGTAEYLAGVAAAAKVPVEVLRAAAEDELAEVLNEAVRRARGEFLVLLNNDTILTRSWLNLMVELAVLSRDIGIVGPMSNYAPPPQRVETVPYRLAPKKGPRFHGATGASNVVLDVSAVDAFAKEWHDKHKGQWQEVERLAGFCLLVRKEVVSKVRPTLQSSADLGLFDAEGLQSKARQAGYKLAGCLDLFIHHFGTRTFAQGGPAAG